MNKYPGFIAFTVFILLVLTQSFFIVDQRQQAIVLQLGQPVGNASDKNSYIKGPGLHFKIPVIQSVQSFDKRILTVDPAPDQVVISSRISEAPKTEKPLVSATENAAPQSSAESLPAVPSAEILSAAETPKQKTSEPDVIKDVTGEPIIVDTFARYRIVDPLQFMKTLRTTANADSRLQSILQNATKAALGNTSLQQLLSIARTNVMQDIQRRVNETIQNDKLGIEIIDVRIVRADLTPSLRQSTVTRMISELKERATETRAKGEEQALRIRSTAEKERTVIMAEAQRDAEKLKGQGDREAIKTYTSSFNKDKDFYAFIRSMEAYKKTLSSADTQLILSPDSDFLKYFKGK